MSSPGREMIYEERLRQIRDEGHSYEGDDAYADGVLEQAGYCYLYLTHAVAAPPDTQGILWPWHPRSWKPSVDRNRNLVRAGALFLAEAERYDRAKKLDQSARLREMASRVAAEIDGQ